jgi:hypothetical protein
MMTCLSALVELKNFQILLVDGDNVPSMAESLMEITKKYGDPLNLQVIVFIARDANFKKINQLVETKSWVRIWHAITRAKNACDIDIAMFAMWLAFNTSEQNSISVFTKDGFALELISCIKILHPDTRQVNWINNEEFQFYLSKLTYKESSPLLLSHTKPFNPAPSIGYICKYCKYPGGFVDSHWAKACPYTPVIQNETPGIGYTCKKCGKRGGEIGSHWFQNCPGPKF